MTAARFSCTSARTRCPNEYADFRKYDIGDIIGVTGFVFKTKTEEISVHVESVTLLSKSLRPLPEKFHGMTDTELRYRQRYVDLIMNPEVADAISMIPRQIHKRICALSWTSMGFMEVETPVLNPIAGGATARPFITHHNTLDIDMYLRIATELHLKRLIVGGIERVYEIGRIFRNEGMDTKHNPEFTTMELYQAYTDFNGMMDLLEGIYLTGAARRSWRQPIRCSGRASRSILTARLAASDHGRSRQGSMPALTFMTIETDEARQ